MDKYLKLNRLIVLFISIGFIVLAFEIYLVHYIHIKANNYFAYIPIVFGFVAGSIGCLIFLLFNRVSFFVFNVLMLLSNVVGLLGLYFHNKWRFPDILKNPLDMELLTVFTPVIAPSAFCAMGALGLLIAYFEPWGKD